MCLVSETPVCPFFTEWASGSRCFSLFLVELGASMMVESTIVPFLRINPRSVRFFYYESKEFFMKVVVDEQIAESADGVAVRNLIAGFHSAEIRKKLGCR